MPRNRYRQDQPANHKQMKKVWAKDPWHWFDCDVRETAEEVASRGHHQWAELIASSQRVVISKKYQVIVYVGIYPVFGEMVHLYIERRDGSKIRPWVDFQRIKNDLIGPGCCAIEVYPQEDELVDDVDMWHLWGFKPEVRMPFHIGDPRPDDLNWTFPGKSNWTPKEE